MTKKENDLPTNFTGTWVTYDVHNPDLCYEQDYVNGVKHGVYRHSCVSTGVAFREGYFENGLEHGTVIVRNKQGKVLSSYDFVYGTGIHKIFSTDDRLGWEVPYQDGLTHGIKRQFENNKLVKETHYMKGRITKEH